jgi:large subunit ribosomal protein L10e
LRENPSETNIVKPSNYREKNAMAYTRKECIGGIPGSKIVKFTMGNISRDFTHKVNIIATKAGQIRHNALEAAKVAALRHLEDRLERRDFLLKIVPYPTKC